MCTCMGDLQIQPGKPFTSRAGGSAVILELKQN